MIEVDGLRVDLGGQTVLSDVDLHVEPGEFVGLVGPNGAGKTTLLNAINGSVSPDAGTVTIDGDSVADLSSRETSQRVATVHQDTSVQFAFDVETIVAMGRTPHRSRFGSDPDGHEHVDRALERTDVAEFRDRRISEVSGGERQRVFLARALAQDAPALLLDEPTASLDVNHATRTLSLVRRLVDDGKATLGAIHDLEAAARYCDRLVLIEDGSVVARGPPESVLTRDSIASVFDTASVVTTNPVTGSPTVTALPATVSDGRRVHVLGGGPVGARVIGDLWGHGHQLSIGPLPAGDAAATVARSLGIPVVTAPGFATVDDETLADARRYVEESAVTVLADIDVSPGTPLLTLADGATSTVLVEERSLAERNHAGETGRRRYERRHERSTVVGSQAVHSAIDSAVEVAPRRPGAHAPEIGGNTK